MWPAVREGLGTRTDSFMSCLPSGAWDSPRHTGGGRGGRCPRGLVGGPSGRYLGVCSQVDAVLSREPLSF